MSKINFDFLHALRRSHRVYLYIQQPTGDMSSHSMSLPSLAACVKEVQRDVDAGMKPGVIFVRYSRVAALLRKLNKLEDRVKQLESALACEHNTL